VIETGVSQAAIEAVSRLLQPPNPGGSVLPLPAGVVLSMREIDHLDPTESSKSVLRAWGALGSFGSLKDMFPGGSTSCALSRMAIEPHAGIALPVFRGVRDGVLASTARGRELTRQYYTHRSEVVRLLARHPQLRREASELARAAQPLLALGDQLPMTLIEHVDRLLEAMAKHASWRLRSYQICCALARTGSTHSNTTAKHNRTFLSQADSNGDSVSCAFSRSAGSSGFHTPA